MARVIDKDRIDNRELSDEEVQYLRDRGKLPKDYFEDDPVNHQASPTIGDAGGIEDEDGEEDYEDGWNNDQRRAELTRRKLSIEGKKDDLIGRLRRSDADQLEDEDYSTLDD